MEIRRLGGPNTFRADNLTKKTLDPVVAFAGAPFAAVAIMDLDNASPSGDQPLVLKLTGDSIYRRSLHAKQAGERLLGQLEPVPPRSWAVSSHLAARASIGWKLLQATVCMIWASR